MKLIPFALIAATSGLAIANNNPIFGLVVDLSGVQFWDEHGSANNETISFTGFATITAISWDLYHTTNTPSDSVFPSWSSDSQIQIGEHDTLIFSSDGFGVTKYRYSGIASFDHFVNFGDIFTLQFFETFDDEVNQVDSYFENGSTLTFHGDPVILNQIPVPGTSLPLAICAMICTRRRRE